MVYPSLDSLKSSYSAHEKSLWREEKMYGINENFYRIIGLTSSRQADHKINLLGKADAQPWILDKLISTGFG